MSQHATLACLNHANNVPLCQGIGGIADAEALPDQTIQRILDCGLKQSERTGFATEKADLKQTMLNAAFTVCSGLNPDISHALRLGGCFPINALL